MSATIEITKPGVYDLTDDVYHADPVPGGSLSSTGARQLLAPSCPALFRHWQDNPQPPRKEFDIGKAAHKLVLGSGPELIEIDFDDWRTKAAKEAVAEARDAGAVPLKPAEFEAVHAMAAAIREHPIAGRLFNPERGSAEQSLFWRDPVSGVQLRARLDWLPHTTDSRMIVADYKTTVSAEPTAIAKSVHAYGYHQQADWYLDGVYSLELHEDAAFVFVFQEKTAPYLVTVAQLDPDAMKWGRVLNEKAIDTYRRCTETGVWPSYSNEVELVQLPVWADRQYEDARLRGDYDTETTR